MLIGGRYETIRELGRGGFGKTYLAEDTYRRNSPKCVVKKIQPQSKLPSVLAPARSLFESEVEKLYLIGKHDQIPKLYDHLEQGGEFYLVQELIDGHDLRQSLFLGDRRDEKEVLGFLHEVLEILAVTHAQNVVHQDLKPQNLLRRWSDKKLVLIDFGNVKVIRHLMVNAEGKPYFTQTVGTAGYVPPEQSAGQPVPASDLYALGMLAIQALTGYSPKQLPRDPATGEIAWRDEARVSAQLADALDGMVRQSVEQRFQSVAEVLAALPALPTAKTLSPEELASFLGEPEPPRYELAIAPQFDLARNFSEGLAAVVQKNRLGYISKSGEIAIPLKIEVDPIGIYREGAYEFSEGLARISVGQRWGYINDLGKLAIAPQFDSAENFVNGLARVEQNHRYGYIDTRGQWLIKPQFESAAPAFREGLAGVEIDHRYGYISPAGKVIIPPQFDSADEFSEGLARVTLQGKYGFIDKTGALVIPAEFDVAHTFQNGLARVRIDGRYGYINPAGELVIPAQFDDTFSFTDGLALVRHEDRYGYIAPEGKVVIPLKFEDAYPFSEGLAAVKLGGLWGFIDLQGTFVVEPQFADAGSFHGDRAAVKQGGRWGYLGRA